MAKRDLQKIIEQETDMSYDEYNGLSTSILAALTEGATTSMQAEIVSAMETGLQQAESIDTSQMTAEQKTQLEQQILEQRKALEEAKNQLASPELQAKKERLDMVTRVREQMGY